MKVAQISYRYKPVRGGQEVYIQNLWQALRQRGVSCTIFQPNWGTSGEDVVLVPRLPLIGRLIPYSSHHLFTLALQYFYHKTLRSQDVLIVHYAFFSKPVWDLADRTIVLSHGIEWNPSLKSAYDRTCQKRAEQSFDHFTIVANDTDYFRHLGLEIAPGKGYFQEVAPGKWFIPNCVNPALFRKTDGVPELNHKKVILIPRQITQDRGIDLGIQAFDHFRQEKQGYHLVILGPVPKSEGKYYFYCQELVRQLGLEGQVTFLKPVPNDRMPDYYSSAALTVIPTLRREGTSLSALESMACGTPTVSTNVAGLSDLPTLQAGPTAAELCEKMVWAVENHAALAYQQREVVCSVLNLDHWAEAWVKVIESVATRRQRRSQ